MINASATDVELFQYAYEMGYGYGRLDQLAGREYDARTPLAKKRDEEAEEIEKVPEILKEADAK